MLMQKTHTQNIAYENTSVWAGPRQGLKFVGRNGPRRAYEVPDSLDRCLAVNH